MPTYYNPTLDSLYTLQPTYGLLQPQVEIQPSYIPYGHDLLSQIYQSLANVVSNYPDTHGLQFRSDKQQKIIDKLREIKQLEEEIAKEYQNAELKRYLQVASRGYIDPNRIPDKNLPQVLEKHSNLLGLTSQYNSKILELSNILEQINNALRTKTSGYSTYVYY